LEPRIDGVEVSYIARFSSSLVSHFFFLPLTVMQPRHVLYVIYPPSATGNGGTLSSTSSGTTPYPDPT
jgi:hypothetical protein